MSEPYEDFPFIFPVLISEPAISSVLLFAKNFAFVESVMPEFFEAVPASRFIFSAVAYDDGNAFVLVIVIVYSLQFVNARVLTITLKCIIIN